MEIKEEKVSESLTFLEILEIIDDTHEQYTLVKNQVLHIGTSSMHYDFEQRAYFKDKNDNAYCVDYTTDYDLTNREGRELINEQVVNGHFEDDRYPIQESEDGK